MPRLWFSADNGASHRGLPKGSACRWIGTNGLSAGRVGRPCKLGFAGINEPVHAVATRNMGNRSGCGNK
jgi:hypothetical protein